MTSRIMRQVPAPSTLAALVRSLGIDSMADEMREASVRIFVRWNDRAPNGGNFAPGVQGWEFRKTPLPPESHRGGVVTMASVLKVTANGTTTSPVLRGVTR